MTTSNDNASNNPPEPSNGTVLSTRTVKVQVKHHPREIFYTGTPTRDHSLRMLQTYGTPEGQERLKYNRSRVHGFVKSLKTGDVVGVEHYQYRVGKAYLRDIQVLVTDRSGSELELGKEYLDKQLAFGFAEILYRDGKPYGIETEKEVTVKIVGRAPTPAADPS